MMRKIFRLLLVIFLLAFHSSYAQVSFGNFAGNDTTLACNINCFTLKIKVPDIRSTDDYKVGSIPYTPYAYTTTTPALSLPCASQDDKFFDATPIGFPFCFYGQSYNDIVIGTNGLVTFDVSNALQINYWDLYDIDASPLPFAGTATPRPAECPDAAEAFPLFPRACIMGVYHDINLDDVSANKKMEFRIEGTAPYRRAIISFNEIPLFDCTSKATHQIVIYENFGYIDVYVKDKAQCSAWNDGNAILGIQNWERDKGLAPPGRNLGSWGRNNLREAWRFTPNGSRSMLDKVELLAGGTVVATGTVGPLSNGNYDIQFTNICPSSSTTTYTVRAYYKSCITGTYSIEDDIVVNKPGSVTASAVVVNGLCSGGGQGTVTISPIGAEFEYSKDGGVSWQANNVFTLSAGNYTFIVRSTITGCTSVTTGTVANLSPIIVTGSHTNLLCKGQAKGQITLNASGSQAPYSYSNDGGASFQNANVFDNLAAGTYPVKVKDALGCTFDTSFTLTEPPILTATVTSSAATCVGNDGTITVSASGGTPGYMYSIDAGSTFQGNNIFKVGPGTAYVITTKDINGCTNTTLPTVVTLNDTMRLSMSADTTVCSGSVVILQPQTNVQTNIFNWSPAAGLNNPAVKNPAAAPVVPTTYTLTAKWGVCERTASVNVNILRKPVVNAGKDTAICDQSPAFLIGSASNLSGTVNYSWSPAVTVEQPNAPATTVNPFRTQFYTLTVTDNYGCDFSVTDNVLVTVQPPVPAFAGNDTNAIAGQPHQLMASGGVSYLWSPASLLNNAAVQNPLAILNADTKFTVRVTDIAGCIGDDEIFIKAYKGPEYYIPNAFTPNGDGLNDLFTPTPVGIVTTYWFRVYNRFGQLIFETNQFRKGWDGTYKGQAQSAGAYVWTLKGVDRNGRVIEKKGTVMLTR